MEISSMYAKEARYGFFAVNCYYHRTYEDFTMSTHSHRRVEIMYVEYGELRLDYYDGDEKKEITLFSHDYVIIDADVKHTIYIPSTSTRIINLEMELSNERTTSRISVQSLMDTDERVNDFFRTHEAVVKLSDFTNVGQLLLIVQENLDNSTAGGEGYRNAFVDFGLATLFIQIASDYSAQTKRLSHAHIKYARKALAYIHSHYQFSISSADIAQSANVSQNYLNLLFKKEFGKTIVDYLNAYRISKAKSIIEKSAIPSSAVCGQVGYRTKQNFNKNFIRYTGMTPKEYRKLMRNKDNTHWSTQTDESTTIFD